MADTNLIPLSGLWKNTSANGQQYLSGKLSPGVRILIFPNKYKQADNQPDYQIYLAPIEREGQAGGESQASGDDFLGEGEAQDAPQAQARPHRTQDTRGGYSGRRTTPEPGGYDDVSDFADPFAE
jgi:uncharacterized protein (DUF736 family)